MAKYILALDQGTSSSRAILFNKPGDVIQIAQKEFTQYYPKPGWVEHNPEEIWESQYTVTKEVLKLAGISVSEIHAIGITNQRETTVVWDKNTGKPVYNAIVWQDKRTSEICDNLKVSSQADYINESTGLVIDSYFSATKIKWILENVVGVKEKAENGELFFGTIDTWLIWKLTKQNLHITDYTNASRTMLFNIQSLNWDDRILNELDIPKTMMPKVVSSSEEIGTTHSELFDGVKIPIAGIAGDQQSALFGQTCFEPGIAKNTYGTGCFILTHTGNKKVKSNNGLLTTLTCDTTKDNPQYALEGAVFIAGAAIKWLRDALHLIKSAGETQKIAEELGDTEGVYVVPAFSGLGAPYWDQHARGGIFGLTLGVSDKHIVRATLESLAYQSKDVLNAMGKDAGVKIELINVDGGASANNYLMQFQADILEAEVKRPKNIETTALGAAFLAGLATGFWNSKEELNKIRTLDKTFTPKMKREKVNTLCKGWQKAVQRTLGWEE